MNHPEPTPWTNRDLFSNHYLEAHLPETDAWQQQCTNSRLSEAQEAVTARWRAEREIAPKRNESQLEETLIRPMFRLLGIPFEVEESTRRTKRRPDYGFFATNDDAQNAYTSRDQGGDFYEQAVAVADAKRWGRPLDTRASGDQEHGFENPSYQIHVYLQETPVRWAVLTDGRRWRLYHGPTSHRLDSFYEVDLEAVIEDGGEEAFKYFYLFFRHEAFVPDSSGRCFLDEVYAESAVFARELGEDLQDNIYRAITELARGFLAHPDNELSEDDLERIHDSSLVYLYRLIFVLYAEAEGRDLLDTDNEIYRSSFSLNGLKQDIAQELDSDSPRYRDWQNDLWSRLDELFSLIDQGSRSRGIPDEDLHVPAYDGGLFRTDPDEADSKEARFLRDQTVGDATLARVIDLLTRSQNRGDGSHTFVDYSSLDVRHLGSIYEGLLEHQLAVADEALTLEDGAYVGANAGDEVIVEAGDVYLTTDAGERKSSGSYYTPEPVVEYIVDETLGPLVDDVRADLAAKDSDGAGGFADEFADRVFELKVLDPAMGSGHFLTSATDYLAREIIDAQEKQAVQHGVESVDEDHDINWARRQVAQRCIYGVDINPLAVELAKVSLWLRTLAAEQPLAFLDHHLKAGNSLVGSDIHAIEELGSEVPDEQRQPTLVDFGVTRKGTIEQLMRIYRDFVAIENQELADVKAMEATYDAFERNTLRQRLEAMANVKTAEDFGLDGLPNDAYRRLAAALEDDEDWTAVSGTEWFLTAQRWAEKARYFHWKLAFPEVYYADDGEALERPGFDAVIGNPPWVATAGRADISATIETDVRSYLEDVFVTTRRQFDLYVAFYEQSIRQSRDGRVGIIVPDAILTREQNEPIRTFVLSSVILSSIVRVGTAFDDVETGAVILISGSGGPKIHCADTNDAGELPPTGYTAIPQDIFEAQDAHRFLIYLDDETRSILATIDDHPPLADYTDISRGEEISKRADMLSERPRDGKRGIAPGGAIRRYDIDDSELRYIDPDDVQKRDSQYDSPKLIFRQTSDTLIGTFDDDDLLTIKSAYNLQSKTGSSAELKHLLGVLNSSVLDFYHYYRHAAYRSVFPQINQSTFARLPVAFADGPDDPIMEAVDDLLSLTAERRAINCDLADYLGSYRLGPSLGSMAESQPAPGVAATMMTATTSERPNLAIGRVDLSTGREPCVLFATARYKPDTGGDETDRWGYTESEPVPVIEFVDLDADRRTLLELFAPLAVERGGGFADFRSNATATISLLDRLHSLRLPAIEDVSAGVERFLKHRARARALDERIDDTAETIETRVAELYGLSDEEAMRVRRGTHEPSGSAPEADR